MDDRTVVLNANLVNYDGKVDYTGVASEVVIYDETPEALILERVDGFTVVVTKEMKVGGDVIRRFPDSVRMICEAGTGYNNIDLEAAREKGIVVCNIPAYSSERVAHTAILLILSLASSLQKQIRMLAEGNHDNFHRHLMVDHVEVNGKTVPGLLAPERIKAATPPPGQAPTFIALGGRGGSGKSSLNGLVYEESRAIVLDADHIKGMLPEYEGWNAHQVHEESSHVLESVLGMAKILGVNVVLDATMKTGKSIESKVDDFKSAGFRTEAHYMHLPRQEATKRAIGRFLNGGEKGRFVPPEVVMGNTKNEHNFDAIKGKVDAWSFHRGAKACQKRE